MKISTKLYSGFASLVALIILLAFIASTQISSIGAASSAKQTVLLTKLEPLYRAREALDQTGLAARNAYIFDNDEQANVELAIIDKQKELYLEVLPTLSASFKNDASFKKVEAGLLRMADQLKKPRQFRQAGLMKEYGTFLVEECSPLRREIVSDIDVVLKNVQAEEALATQRENKAQETSQILILVVSILSILFAIAISVLITRTLIKRLGGEPAYAADISDQIAKGNLSVKIDTLPNDDSSLLFSIQHMRDGLIQIVSRVRSGTDSIAEASTQIAAGNLDLSARTEHQAGTLEKISASTKQLLGSVSSNADNTEQAGRLAETASLISIDGGMVVGQVIETMNNINNSSEKIAGIIDVMNSIAFQTNILALNAAVEAARAGEQGRGFAVVAAEVRALAQRSAAAAHEIKELINESVHQVQTGTALVGRAGSTMHDVVDAIKKVTTNIGEIKIATREQRSSIEQIDQALGGLDDVTQQNSALVEEAAAAAASLQDQASELAHVVSVFKIHDHSAHSALAPASQARLLQGAMISARLS